MISHNLENLAKIGKLKREAFGQVEIEQRLILDLIEIAEVVLQKVSALRKKS